MQSHTIDLSSPYLNTIFCSPLAYRAPLSATAHRPGLLCLGNYLQFYVIIPLVITSILGIAFTRNLRVAVHLLGKCYGSPWVCTSVSTIVDYTCQSWYHSCISRLPKHSICLLKKQDGCSFTITVFLQGWLATSIHDEVATNKMCQLLEGKMSMFLILEETRWMEILPGALQVSTTAIHPAVFFCFFTSSWHEFCFSYTHLHEFFFSPPHPITFPMVCP